MPPRSTSVRKRKTPEDWADAALAVIAESGLASLAVEPLAARLGTTKGSFYWHFPSREALLEAALARWEELTTTAVIREIGTLPEGPAQQLHSLIVRVVEMAERDPVGPALLANADHPAVKPVLERVTQARLGLIVGIFERLGFPAEEARLRALLAYSAYLGHAQLAHSTPAQLPGAREERQSYLDLVVRLLTA